MPKSKKGAKGTGAQREIEQLRKRRLKAQDNGDVAEEAKLCNAIGELYAQSGEYTEAIRYHRCELALSEAAGDRQGAGIAHRKIGECECELQHYTAALQHQSQHLKIAREMGDLVEEQRALATLGRTHLVQHSQAALEQAGGAPQTLLASAGKEFLKSLDICDRLVGAIPEMEVLQMRSRLYLNLGLVYENKADLSSARKFMEKALSIVKELGDQETTFRCHYDLGLLHMQERHPALALRCFQAALGVARELSEPDLEGEALAEMAQAHVQLGNFEPAKSCLKKVLKLPRVGGVDLSVIESQLKTVRKIVHYSGVLGSDGMEDARERIRLLDKLGDLACGVSAFPAAVKFYGKQLGLAEAHGLESAELRPIYSSLARTHSDLAHHSQALHYYSKELELWRGNPTEECDTLVCMARVHEAAAADSHTVLEVYHRAVALAELAGNTQQQAVLYGVLVQYCQSQDPALDAEQWRGKRATLLAAHPQLEGEGEGEKEGEEGEGEGEGDSSDLPLSLSSDSEDDDDSAPRQVEALAVVRPRKRRVDRRNEKGETLLQVAAIDGNLTAVKQLLSQGADVNSRDHCGWLPLHEACNHGHLEVVATLLGAGAALNDPGCSGITPLIDAATNGHLDVVRLLVDKGADVSKKDNDGRTALAVVEERLSSRAELGRAYELEEEHTAIKDFLRAVMLRKGCPVDDRTVPVPAVTSSKQTTRAKSAQRTRGIDRSGTSVLDSSDEEERTSKMPPQQHKPLSDNPFQNLTVGPVQHSQVSRASTAPSQPGSRSGEPLQSYTYNPLEQVEGPALISEEDSSSRDNSEANSHPIVDDWLIEDMERPPAKRVKHTSEQCAAGPSLSLSERRPAGPTRVSTARSKLRQSRLAVPSREKRKTVRRERNANRTVLIESDFDDSISAHLMDTDHIERVHDNSSVSFGSSVAPTSQYGTDSTQSRPTLPPGFHPHHHHQQQHQQQQQQVDAPPLRVKVKIEGKLYLIPCPRQWEGAETTVSWLMAQASQRYYSQHGVRPQLSLTTLDGALLSASDVVAHLLQHNEEVLGLVEQWHLPPLAERYQTACKNSQVAPNSKVLELLKTNASSPSLDLSGCGLGPRDSAPLLQALPGQRTLCTLVLARNRLRDGCLVHLASALCALPALHVLDLSCTGLTAEGIETLTQSFPPSSDSADAQLLPFSGLHSLALSHNQLGGASGRGLALLLSRCPALQELKLESCGLTSAALEGHTGLAAAIKDLSGLTAVSVALNPLGSRGVGLLLQALEGLALTRLSISGSCGRGSSVGDGLAALREAGNSIEWLDVSHCGLESGDVGCLRSLCALQVVNLAGNAFTHHNLQSLCSIIAAVDALRVVDLSGNPGLGNAGSMLVLRACSQRAHSLRELSLAACALTSPLPHELADALSKLQLSQETQLEMFAGNDLDYSHFEI